MIIAPEEKSSRGPLIAFIDLLFLVVAFFTLVIFFLQHHQTLSQQQLKIVQEKLAAVTGEQVDVPQALETLQKVVDKYVATREAKREQEKAAAARRERKAQRETVRLEYTIGAGGRIHHEGKTYTLGTFLAQVVAPLRKDHWVAFRAYAAPQTPFGSVIEQRQVLLKDSNEFDTYWDNVTREEQPPAAAQPAK
ncbi:MAG TPA: hypothetical protein VKB51_18345 [bacterium]|nr:hypothetical protein [bacterium]